jgi:predicted P-loop ATPase
VRDQLRAEAVYRYKRGACWWLETPELEGLAAAEQAARFILDAWEGPIREWLSSRVAIPEVLEHALAFPHQDWTESAQKRAGKILTLWASLKGGTEKGREYRYRREPAPQKSQP